MERWLKQRTLKRSNTEPDSFALNSNVNDGNNEYDTYEIDPKDFSPVTKKCRKYDENYV